MPRVSVVVPTYNRADLLRDCLSSIVAQTYDDYEVVLIDDGSTDDTASVAIGFGEKVRYIPQKNTGVPGALNRGISESRGELIRFLASDDRLEPHALATEVSLMHRQPEAGLLYSQAWQIDETGNVTELRKPEFASGSYVRSGLDEIRDLLFWDHITCSTVMVRKSCFDELGLFDESLRPFGEDWDMWVRIARRHSVAYLAQPLASYLKHSGNISMTPDLAHMDHQRKKILDDAFADPAVAKHCRDLRGKAYFAYHADVAAMAYKSNQMGIARRQLAAAARSEPSQLLKPMGMSSAFLFAKTLIPAPLLGNGRAAMTTLREKLRHRKPNPGSVA